MRSLATIRLSKPDTDARIPPGRLAYLRARHQGNVHSMLLEEFQKSGAKKAVIARRLGLRPEQITRLLSNPNNLTLDTLSDLLFAMTGTEPQTLAREFGAMDVEADAATKAAALESLDVSNAALLEHALAQAMNAPISTGDNQWLMSLPPTSGRYPTPEPHPISTSTQIFVTPGLDLST